MQLHELTHPPPPTNDSFRSTTMFSHRHIRAGAATVLALHISRAHPQHHKRRSPAELMGADEVANLPVPAWPQTTARAHAMHASAVRFSPRLHATHESKLHSPRITPGRSRVSIAVIYTGHSQPRSAGIPLTAARADGPMPGRTGTGVTQDYSHPPLPHDLRSIGCTQSAADSVRTRLQCPRRRCGPCR